MNHKTLFILGFKNMQSKTKSIERTYWALVMGIPGAKEGRISAPLAKVDPTARIKL